MSEKPKSPYYQDRTIEDYETLQTPRAETVQFNDGQLGILYRFHGAEVDWENLKYGDMWSNAGLCAIVKTSNGQRFAFGKGASVQLPELDTTTGKFRKGTHTTAARLATIAPNGLPPATIGEQWATLDDQGTVESIMLRYKTTFEPAPDQYPQIDMPEYFESALELLDKAHSSQQLP